MGGACTESIVFEFIDYDNDGGDGDDDDDDDDGGEMDKICKTPWKRMECVNV